MNFDDKMDLLDDALDALRKVQNALAEEGKTPDADKADSIRNKILDLKQSLMADEYYEE